MEESATPATKGTTVSTTAPFRRALTAVALVVGLVPALGSAPAAASTCRPAALTPPPRIGGVARVHPERATCSARSFAAATSASDLYNGGTPPLLPHSDIVMGTPSVVVTPVFWGPAGAFTAGYVNTVTQYLRDVAHDSGTRTNVFSTLGEYGVAYRLGIGAPIMDANPYPTSGCTVDAGPIYADTTGYSACFDDAQLQAEAGTASGGRGGLGQLFVMLLPKGVESCFYPASDTSDTQACTINSTPSGSYCGYHGYLDTPGTVYAALPFPVYGGPPANGSCTDEGLGGGVQAPNGAVNRDADVLISTLSHEVAEALTDPHLDAWYDNGVSVQNENGDECAYDYGSYSGSPGAYWNQTINGHRYLTQTEFSNDAYFAGRYACIQTKAAPAVTAVSPGSGPTAGGRSITLTGTAFTGASQVTIGAASVPFTVRSDTSITAVTPPHGSATIDIRVTTPGGTTATRSADRYRYGVPVVTALSQTAGATSAGHLVYLAGTGFTGATKVLFGSTAARFTVTSDSRITALTPAHSQSAAAVVVVNGAGSSAVSATTRYLFLAPPRITRVSPGRGTRTGGTTVTITGSNFFRVRGVRFGYTAASFTVNSSTRLTVRTPAHAAGSVNILVYTPGGTSAVTTADRYAFT
jgi:hypothetical protein